MHFLAIISLLPVLSGALPTAFSEPSATAARQIADSDIDCVWAGKYQPYTYLDCSSTIDYSNFLVQTPSSRPIPTLIYSVLMTGTGQDVDSWCTDILDGIKTACGNRLITPIACGGSNETAVVVLDGDDNWTPKLVQGMDLTFQIQYGSGASFSGLDHDHGCIADAITKGTCGTVSIANGASCISNGYLVPQDDDTHLQAGLDVDNEVDNLDSPAIDPFANM